MLKMKSNNKILALALSLMLLVNTFAGLTFSSSAAVSPWIWEPYTTGSANANNVTVTNNAGSGYTTFTVKGTDPYVYPGLGAGSLAATPALGKINASSLKYGLVRYRTSTAAPGSILANSGVLTLSLSYNGTGVWTDLELDLNKNSSWTGDVDWFRYDMFDGDTGTVDVAFIAFFETDADRDTYAANRAMPVDYEITNISVYGPDLKAINYAGSYNIDTADGYTAFGTSWTAAGFAEGSSLVRMAYNNFVYVGNYNFKNVVKVEITYHTDGAFKAEDSANPGTYATLGFSKVQQSFGWAGGEKAHFNNAIAYGALSNGTANGWPAARTLTITEGIDTSYNGAVYLANYGCNGAPVVVTGIKLYSTVSETYDVSVGTVSNGTVALSKTGNVDYGTTVTVTATPATGYKLDEILVNGTAITGTTFTVTAASVVTATFTKLQYAVSVGTVSNGTVTLSKTGNVDYGTTVTVTATPATGYKLDKIFVNGTAITGNTFTVTAASVVTATFTELPPSVITYEVSVGTVENGTVAVSVNGTVEKGTTITVTATPSTGYELDKILVNGTAITGNTFEVTGNSVVTATFKKIQCNVSVGTVAYGTVTLSPSGTVDYGTTVTVTATPDADYELTEILVNGTPITGTTFEVTSDATVTATFTYITPAPTPTYDGSINIDSINSNIWVGNTTIVFGDSYGGEVNGIYHNAILCEYSAALDAYVVVEKWNVGESRTMQLGAGKIIIDSAGSGVAENQAGWDTVQVGSVIYLEGVDFNSGSLSPNGAVAYISNNPIAPADTFTVTVGTVENGTVTVSPEGEVATGTTVIVTVTPAEGYVLEAIYVNGDAIDGDTFVVDADAEVTATFVADDTTDGDGTTDGDDVIDGDGTTDGDDVIDGDGTTDGDDVIDGDDATDGDDAIDGDGTTDGDDVIDGDGITDGDDATDGDGITDGDDATDGDETDNAETDDAAVAALVSLMIAAAFMAILLKKRSTY